MATKHLFDGVLVPVLTPFDDNLEPDAKRFTDLCFRLLDDGAAGLAVFGTTSEANSMSIDEKERLFDALLEAGFPAERLMPGVGSCALSDAVRLTKKATAAGCGGVLLLPPFYYRIATDDGLFDYVDCYLDKVGEPSIDIYLYHIPPMAVVGWSLDLIERLLSRFPKNIVGIKDSTGDKDNTFAIIDRFPGFRVYPGSEKYLVEAMARGASGCISASANINVAKIAETIAKWDTPEAGQLQKQITDLRLSIENYPMIPALKAILADERSDPAWRRVRPPLQTLDDAKASEAVATARNANS